MVKTKIIERWDLVKDEYEIWGDLKKEALERIKEILEGTMEIYREQIVSANYYERNSKRENYRNGYYKGRSITTQLGEIKLDVPKVRKGSIKIPGIGKYKRFSPDFEQFIFESFFAGVSTRKMKRLSKVLTGQGISPQKVSSLIKTLKHKVEIFHSKKIKTKYKYLIIDGIWIKVVNLAGRVVKKPILVAIGVTKTNKKEIIGFRLTSSEAKVRWNEFIGNLIYRGLNPDTVQCIVSDEHPSIIETVSLFFPHCKHQYCVCHHINNVIKHLKKKYTHKYKQDKKRIVKDLSAIYAAKDKKSCIKKFKLFINKWYNKYEKAFKSFIKNFEHTIYYYDFDEEDRKIIKTSNHIELFFREFRRRIKVFGFFKNNLSVDILFFTFAFNFNNQSELFSNVFTLKN